MKKGRVLVVDDQEEILSSLGAILTDEGHEVLKARDGQDALHIVQSDSPDIVFLDIWIPGIDGMQTLKAIKRISPKCHVIMMSGHGTIETAVKAIKLGAEDYLEKPLNLEDTLHLVEKAISAKGRQSEASDFSYGDPGPLIGSSQLAANTRRSVENAANETGSVWIYGEKGSGKEFLARKIHFLAGNDRYKLVKVSCEDLTSENIREVLLGKLGNRDTLKNGNITNASPGTVILVGLDRLKQGLETIVMKVLQDIDHLGKGSQDQRRYLRSLFTSKMSPEEMVLAGYDTSAIKFFSERIIRVPPLRERPEDIGVLVRHFLTEASREFDKEIIDIEADALNRLQAHTWPGNIKELKILVEHAVMNTSGNTLAANELLLPISSKPCPYQMEKQTVLADTISQPVKDSPQHVTERRIAAWTASGAASVTGSRLQKTLRGKVVIYGQGLHSGQKTGLTISPLPVSSGINFGHITSGGTVPALLSFVESTDFCTSLRGDDALARTIEHLMAVFHVYGLTNLLVKISGEVPIMDGSALEFCNLVENAEIITQDEIVNEIRIEESIELPLVSGSPKSMRIEPSEFFEVEYHMDYPRPIGKMSMSFRLSSIEDFKSQIAPARTFGFVKDVKIMDEMGLAGGGRLSNLILLDEEKVVNPPLRFENEFVRHKILDIIGDFYLLGRPIVGKIIAKQTGHSDNIAMLRLINDRQGQS
ncbi:MAG: UDP-3-O-acyl-N-acetylglucosamine deacetylase [Desulfomonilaceae bacterium]